MPINNDETMRNFIVNYHKWIKIVLWLSWDNIDVPLVPFVSNPSNLRTTITIILLLGMATMVVPFNCCDVVMPLIKPVGKNGYRLVKEMSANAPFANKTYPPHPTPH